MIKPKIIIVLVIVTVIFTLCILTDALSNETIGLLSKAISKIHMLESRKADTSRFVSELDEALTRYQTCVLDNNQECEDNLIEKLETISVELDDALARSSATYYMYMAKKIAIAIILALMPLFAYIFVPKLIGYAWLKTKSEWIVLPRTKGEEKE